MREQALAGQGFLDRLRRGRGFDHALMTVRARVLGTRRLDDHKAGRLVLEFRRDRFADPRARVPTGAGLVGVGHVDLHPAAREMRRERPAPRRPPARMAPHRRLPRIHLEGLGDGAWLVGERLERQLQLVRIDALGLLPE